MNPATTAPKVQSNPTPAIPRGHAAFRLSGRAVLGAWLVSIVAHTMIFALMLWLVFPFGDDGKDEEAPAVLAQVVGSLESSGFAASPTPDLTQEPQIPDPARIRPRPQASAELSRLASIKRPELSIIGIGAGGGDGDMDRFPIDLGLSADFFGLGGSVRGARRIVYVVDRSGSMMDTFVYVQAELKRSVKALRRSQRFHVIFFNSGALLENPPKKLVSAIGSQKERFFQFLDSVVPRGDTKPAAALQRALSLKPDILYLLSDGIDFEPRLLQFLDQWNADRRTRIFTIAYLDQRGGKLLERIAHEHNGEFKYVTEHDLP